MKMAVKERSESDEMDWTVEEEIQLFLALEGLKPIGINKHFYMACICDRLSKSLKREVSSDAVWAHLRTLYNLDLLEADRTASQLVEKDFSLPESEFSALIAKKMAEVEDNTKTESNSSIKSKSTLLQSSNTNKIQQIPKEVEKKIPGKITPSEIPKRSVKRTRGSTSLESNSPSTTPPPVQHKRRRI